MYDVRSNYCEVRTLRILKMKTVLTFAAAALTLSMTLGASANAGSINPAPATLQFPTDFDGFMASKGKKATAKRPVAKAE